MSKTAKQRANRELNHLREKRRAAKRSGDAQAHATLHALVEKKELQKSVSNKQPTRTLTATTIRKDKI